MHPGGGEQVELEDGRPAVEGVRAAVDLGDERSRSGAPGCLRVSGRVPCCGKEPALDLTPIDGHPALDRLAQLDLGEGVAVQICQPARGAGLTVADPEVVELGR